MRGSYLPPSPQPLIAQGLWRTGKEAAYVCPLLSLSAVALAPFVPQAKAEGAEQAKTTPTDEFLPRT
jgi:hypothetical protein